VEPLQPAPVEAAASDKPAPRPAAKRPPARAEAKPPRQPEVEHGTGQLVVASSPWCQVAVDGVARGPTPLHVDLPAGTHTVELTNAQFHIARKLTVLIHAHQTVRKSLDFGE
jgi:hypothetical protein